MEQTGLLVLFLRGILRYRGDKRQALSPKTDFLYQPEEKPRLYRSSSGVKMGVAQEKQVAKLMKLLQKVLNLTRHFGFPASKKEKR